MALRGVGATAYPRSMSSEQRQPPFTPPGWLNAVTRTVLRTPGLERLVGRSTALITFTGRTTGRSYTTPVTYTRRGERVIMTAHPSRQWWRNLQAHPQVELRLAGVVVGGTARVVTRDGAFTALTSFFEDQPMAARAAGLKKDATGTFDRQGLEDHLTDTVVIVVDLAPVDSTV